MLLDGVGHTQHFRDLATCYRREFEGEYYRPEMRRDSVLLIVLRSQGSPDPDPEELGWDITKPRRSPGGTTASFAEPRRPRFWVSTSSLLEQARHEPAVSDYVREKHRCIHEQA